MYFEDCKHVMPCKHMFAIMDHIEHVSWLSFSGKYRQSPYLRLDNTVVNEDGIPNQSINDSIRLILKKVSSEKLNTPS